MARALFLLSLALSGVLVAHATTQTFYLYEKSDDKVNFLPAVSGRRLNNAAAGDRLLFNFDVRYVENFAAAGRSSGECTYLYKDFPWTQVNNTVAASCQFTFRFADGTITVGGTVRPLDNKVQFPILGGTGKFNLASGFVEREWVWAETSLAVNPPKLKYKTYFSVWWP